MQGGSIDQLGAMIPYSTRGNSQISNWSVGQQIHHALTASLKISESMVASTPGKKRQRFHPARFLVLALGRIPRGRGRAPRASIPPERVDEETLRFLLEGARQAMGRARNSGPLAYWEHFAFGVMERDTALRFIEIHNRHHLRIIQDILASSP